MQITLEGKAREFVEHLVRAGCHPSAQHVVDSLLRDQAEKLATLRSMLDEAEESGEVSEDELDASLAATLEELKREGIPE